MTGRRGERGAWARSGSGLATNVHRLQSLRALGDVELHRLALGQRLEPLLLDGGVVNEDVLLTIPRDEPIPLRITEPLHLSGCHSLPPTRTVDPISDGH